MVVVSNACCDNSEDMLKLLAILLSQGVVISAFTLQMGELMYVHMMCCFHVLCFVEECASSAEFGGQVFFVSYLL